MSCDGGEVLTLTLSTRSKPLSKPSTHIPTVVMPPTGTTFLYRRASLKEPIYQANDKYRYSILYDSACKQRAEGQWRLPLLLPCHNGILRKFLCEARCEV
jgi:hypothetical protein